jgi:hypothetical protein
MPPVGFEPTIEVGERSMTYALDRVATTTGNNNNNNNNNVLVIKPRRMRWTRHVARIGEERGVYRVWVARPEGKRPPERPRCRWEDNNNNKMDLQEVGCGRMDWIELAHNRLAGNCEWVINLRVS